MYTQKQYREDLRILHKARNRVRTVLALGAAAVCLYPAAVFMILEQPLFEKPVFFNLFYLGSMLVQMVIWLLLFYYASTGSLTSRKLFTAGAWCELGFAAYLLYDLFRQLPFIPVYIAWILLLLVKTFALFRLSSWFHSSYWAKIYYDRILTLPASMKPKSPVRSEKPRRRSSPEQPVVVHQKPKADLSSPAENPQETAARIQREKKAQEARYPRMALRILIFVVTQMIVFPIFVHLSVNSFVSIDNTSVFADNLEFTLCIITTVIWLLPIFFLYLKSPGWKRMFYLTLGAQFLLILFEVWTLWNYGHSETVAYSARVFLQFAMVEIARYALLAVGVLPAFRLPEITDNFQTEEEDDPLPSDSDAEDTEYEILIEPEDEQQDSADSNISSENPNEKPDSQSS